jgi:small-conductance mechanosensitive channel
MILPNHKFITENVLNWTHHDTHPSAFRIQVRVSHAADERIMLALLTAAAASQQDILNNDPERRTEVRFSDFQDKCVVYEVRFWTHKKLEAEQVQSDLRLAIQQQIREQGIPFPKD